MLQNDLQDLHLICRIANQYGNGDSQSDVFSSIQNWTSFAQLVHKNGLAPIIHQRFKETSSTASIPESFIEECQQIYYRVLSKNIIHFNLYQQIREILTVENFHYIPLKGIALSEFLYGDIGLRPMSDIDLLFRVY